MDTKSIYLSFIFLWLIVSFNAQNFINSDLEGVETIAAAPPGWEMIPFGDPVCLAYISAGCTPDITGPTGPVPSLGIYGIPNSGQTFISGLHTGWPGSQYHEGIMQNVIGLIPGENYPIEFFQSVVKQDNMLDNSGSWAVYMDNTLIGITVPSISLLSYLDINLQWDYRSVSFTATNTSHLIKFIPMDDDPSQIQPDEGLRMGIDGISFVNPGSTAIGDSICVGDEAIISAFGATSYQWAEESNPSVIIGNDDSLYVNPITSMDYILYTDIDTNIVSVVVITSPIADLGIDQTMCNGDSIILSPNASNVSNFSWSNSSSDSILVVNQAGIYWVTTANDCGYTTDSIQITSIDSLVSNFSEDTIACIGETIVLESDIQNCTYLWFNGDTTSIFVTSQEGQYWLELSNGCFNSIDTFSVEYVDCETILEMPNVFTVNNDEINDFYVPIKSNNIGLYELVIINRWGNVIFESKSLNIGWDGKYQGNDCSNGVYFWRVDYSDYEGVKYHKDGYLTLIK